jgi:hypothetical protein
MAKHAGNLKDDWQAEVLYTIIVACIYLGAVAKVGLRTESHTRYPSSKAIQAPQ